MLDAGSVYATLGGRFSPSGFTAFDGAMKKSIASAAKAEESTNKSTAAMGKFGTIAKTGAAAGVLALAAATVVSVKQAANFQQAMAEVQAVTKAGSADMKRMSNAALDLGAKTGVGATKAAGALAELAKGGLTTKQTIGALKGTIAMAQAGSMDLGEAATTVAQALNLFALSGEDASHVADAFATAANKTTADVSFFAQGLAQGGAAAKAAGLNFDQTTAALEIMAANGFKSGSDAGTSLKTSLIQLAHPTKKAQEVTKQLGLDFFKSNGEMKSLTSISAMLGDKFDGLSRKQRLASAATLVGTDGMRALLALYDQGPDKVRQFEKGLAAQGSAQDVATAKMDNLKGSWQRLVAQLQTLSIRVGTAMLPTLKSAADGVTRFFDSLNKGNLRATGFGRMLDDARSVVGPILGVFSTIARGAALALGAVGKVPGFGLFKTMAREASIAADGIDGLRSAMDNFGKKKPKDVKITARLQDQVTPTLIRISRTHLGDKVQRILGDDKSVQQKVRALRALGINGPTARFLAQTGSVEGAIAAIAGRSVTIPVNFKAQPFSATPPGRAQGTKTSGPEIALIGEGRGPEWVIPSDPQYRGRAISLLTDAMSTILPGYAKGTKKNGKGPSKKETARRQRVDQRIQDAGTQADTADTRMQMAQDENRRKAFETSKKTRLAALARERARIVAEMKRAKGSRRVSLQNQLARVEADVAATQAKQYEAPSYEQPTGAGTSGTDLAANLSAMIDEWDAKLALAQLDTPLNTTDDLAALTGKQGFLKQALAAVRADPARYGGASAITRVASEITATAQAIKDIRDPALTADQQAQADQARQRGFLEGRTSSIDRLVGAATGSPVTVNFNALTASPKDARVAAETIIGGIGAQGGRQSTTTRVGP